MKVGILSDVHGNITALTAVLEDLALNHVHHVMLLGDIIDYGPHSNQIIQLLRRFKGTVLCNIHGNHENAITCNHMKNFHQTVAGNALGIHAIILPRVLGLYKNVMTIRTKVIAVENKKILAVHGSLEDNYWKAIKPNNNLGEYCEYDYVFRDIHIASIFLKFIMIRMTRCIETRRKRYLSIRDPWGNPEICALMLNMLYGKRKRMLLI